MQLKTAILGMRPYILIEFSDDGDDALVDFDFGGGIEKEDVFDLLEELVEYVKDQDNNEEDE